ncbi:hypothetical protein SAMN05421636_108161 [Pricia antarctica]|uniref:Uncharacterized protein n=1 Tax=Pricia antarctica TaxID=641691 RepID=A0A1G7GIP0_9FLAO|nr:hypothetical protein SAMN05421636_108161 [Pricia antarctica]
MGLKNGIFATATATFSTTATQLLALRQRSLQYFTSSQFFPHFLRQVNGLPQVVQIFTGKLVFLWAIIILVQ